MTADVNREGKSHSKRQPLADREYVFSCCARASAASEANDFWPAE